MFVCDSLGSFVVVTVCFRIVRSCKIYNMWLTMDCSGVMTTGLRGVHVSLLADCDTVDTRCAERMNEVLEDVYEPT